MKNQVKQKFCGGFTLLEIMVVVVISLVVVMFSVPMYKKAQYKNHYLAAQGVLLDVGNGVRMFKANYPDYTFPTETAYCNITANKANSSATPPTSCSGIVGWLMTNKYINQIPFAQDNISNRYRGYFFRIDLNATGDIACCTNASNANAIACMARLSSNTGGTDNNTPTCAWITQTGEFAHN
ncbi:MAG: prepilin-type N-terminal cleavage/methylation domain-containing protein [Elusimicrobiaceae bacterium]|nr:prepilin-type N-terminal cleavage/methylation domain-containing protein [Elusimicrobiaceae bacterium]